MRTSPLLILVLLSLPTVAAGWTSHGQPEPDTALDAAGPFMWHDAPPAGATRLYFQVFPTFAATGVNPNVALLQTRYQPTPAMRFEALLGVWSDCNGDGTIGLAEGALEEYPAPLLGDLSQCAPGGPHHDGRTVRELLAVGRGPSAALRDDEARVWGDFGAPGASGFEACRAYPLPRGTTANTGRLFRVLDCASEHRLVGIVNTMDNDGSLGLAIEDPHYPERSDSLLIHNLPVNLFGNPINGQHGLLEDDAPPAFTVWDCDAGALSLGVANDPTSTSWFEGAERTADGFAGDCDTTTPFLPVEAEVEAPFEPTLHTGRDQNDVVFTFTATPPARFTFDPWQDAGSSGPAAPEEGARWRSTSEFVGPPPVFDRRSLEPVAAAYRSFYAWVGEATLQRGVALPTPVIGVYGSEACGANDAGIHRGWLCDAAGWWLDPGGDTMPVDERGHPWGARVGALYRLRDVDCDNGAAWWLADTVCV